MSEIRNARTNLISINVLAQEKSYVILLISYLKFAHNRIEHRHIRSLKGQNGCYLY